jgi:brefeldin A-inhibited guanine nucleotide-exchange protein
MSKDDFIKNNLGINEGPGLPPEFLTSIYGDIFTEEIRTKDEIETSKLLGLPNQPSGVAGALANIGHDLQKDAYVTQSTDAAHETEVRASI